MKLKGNNMAYNETWFVRRFAIFPVQLGRYGICGELLIAEGRVWWEHYYVEYTISTGYFGPYNMIIRKYQK